MATFSIVPVQSSDLPVLAEFLLASKLCLAVNRLLWKNWPNEAAQRPNYTSALESGFASPQRNQFKAVDAAGEIVGFVVLSQKKASDTEKPPVKQNQNEKPQEILDSMHPEVLKMIMEAVDKVDKEAEGKDHLELTYVYVKPSKRNKGIGSKLVQLGFDKAKAEGLPIILGSEPEAHDFFVRLGFKDTKYGDMDLAQWAPPNSGFGNFRLWGMIWDGEK